MRGKKIFIAAACLIGAIFVAFFCWKNFYGDLAPVEVRLSSWPRSVVVRDRRGDILSVTLSEDGEFCLPVPLSQMGSWMPLAAVETEDRRFASHGGVDWLGIARALRDNFFSRKFSGASTITSQVIRICLPAERTISTKLREFSQAMRLEKLKSKDEILEIYLNIVPLGGGLRGVEAASRAWFGHSSCDLTIAQAALLTAMIKGPTAYRPDLHPEAALSRRNWIISTLHRRGKITDEQERAALAEPLPVKLHSLPGEEWIFCQKVLSQTDEKDVTSTLDRSAQKILQAALAESLSEQDPHVTAAGVLIENATGAVRAYVANARFGSKSDAEWVDCASSPRSPGSALKPFVYAAAFDDGFLTPSTMLADTPLSFSGRAPRNFDRLYRGPVTTADALADSLNAPAVRVLRKIGGERFLAKLRELGFSSFTHDASYYGDSLILGGCEVTPLQLCGAVTSLARGGRSVAPRFVENSPLAEQKIFSPAAAWLTTQILSDRSRMPTIVRAFSDVEMAFKTGTSYGLRDAWTAAWNDRWSLVVWLGDPRSEPHMELVGLGAAVPAALKVFRAMGGNFGEIPEGITRREVCSLSGLPPSNLCPNVREEFFIRGVSSEARCTMHRIEGGKIIVAWPPELASLAENSRDAAPLSISSPLNGASYLMQDGGKLILRAEGSDEFFWYLDGRFVGRGTPERPYLWPMSRGRHKVTVMDSLARRQSVEFTVYTLDKNTQPELPELVPEE